MPNDRNLSSDPDRGRYLFLLPSAQTGVISTQPPVQSALWEFSPGIKWLRREGDKSPSSTFRDKNTFIAHTFSWCCVQLATRTALHLATDCHLKMMLKWHDNKRYIYFLCLKLAQVFRGDPRAKSVSEWTGSLSSRMEGRSRRGAGTTCYNPVSAWSVFPQPLIRLWISRMPVPYAMTSFLVRTTPKSKGTIRHDFSW